MEPIHISLIVGGVLAALIAATVVAIVVLAVKKDGKGSMVGKSSSVGGRQSNTPNVSSPGSAGTIVHKPVGDFTQSHYNPRDPSALTDEAKERKARWDQIPDDRKDIRKFIKQEISDFINSIPDDMQIVFLGSFPDDIRPDETRDVPVSLPATESTDEERSSIPKVLAIVDGAPGSGKSTICVIMDNVVTIVQKDVDDFTQWYYNPRHPTALTDEAKERKARWDQIPDDGKDIWNFIKQEISDFINSIPDDRHIVFCGLFSDGIRPDEMRDVPVYLLTTESDEELVRRLSLRSFVAFVKSQSVLGTMDCQALIDRYKSYKNYFETNFMRMDLSAYDHTASSHDGALIIEWILGKYFATEDVKRVQNIYRSFPSVQGILDEITEEIFKDTSCKILA